MIFKSIGVFIILCAFSSNILSKECDRSITASTPNQRFKDRAIGTIFDTKTGLTWARCPIGMKWDKKRCLDTPNRMSWSDAYYTIVLLNQQSGFAGFRDWRLPTLEELSSLVELQCYQPSINRKIFPNTPSIGFWSSTKDLYHVHGAWLVYFLHGSRYMSNQEYEWAIRLVRK